MFYTISPATEFTTPFFPTTHCCWHHRRSYHLFRHQRESNAFTSQKQNMKIYNNFFVVLSRSHNRLCNHILAWTRQGLNWKLSMVFFPLFCSGSLSIAIWSLQIYCSTRTDTSESAIWVLRAISGEFVCLKLYVFPLFLSGWRKLFRLTIH